ncbi:putative leucine-rich repeat protein [Chondrus crispus]|uniref:Putative leucine-rich repeat protein n=1 Tax=Chondrus crispus TaxID=2769 RepID=R7Q531_CHOCR|nr:putative leucine-rich repeat protein [Chondrus crispus]CDF32466.1 putative leucine-rich repeat protein [Chondrus crispus]|eukprot:XP_005712131.1 putative leucine-rich repeat protein [Chondrus crispus]
MKIKLRTLFILVTLAIFLAVFILEPFVQRQQEKQARGSLQERFGTVEFRTTNGATKTLKCVGEPGGSQSIETKTLTVFRELDSLELKNCHVKNTTPTTKLYIEALDLERVRLDLDIPMNNLKELIVSRSSIGIWFTPSETKLTPAGFDFRPFRNASSLESITISNDFINGFHGLESLPNLRGLSVIQAKIYSIEGIDQIEALRSLSLTSDWQREITPSDIKILCNCQSLEFLVLSNDFDLSAIEAIKNSLPQCEILIKQ